MNISDNANRKGAIIHFKTDRIAGSIYEERADR